MIERKVTVQLKNGLQARPAALFVQEANRYASDVQIVEENKKVNAKSIMGIMSLAVAQGTEITLQVSGSDEAEAVVALAKFIESEDH